jgi:hypothetical protein
MSISTSLQLRWRKFEAESGDVATGETVSIMEITMRKLMREGEVDLGDFISRADVLATTGHTVMISDFAEYYRLAAYLFRYTSRASVLQWAR